MTTYNYAFSASGHDVANGSLTLFDTFWLTYTTPRRITVMSQPINLYPIRENTPSGRVRGGGLIPHILTVRALPVLAFDHYIDVVLPNDIIDAPVTLRTRRHERGTYERWNAYAVLPIPGEQYRYENRFVMDVQFPFNLVEFLSSHA